MFYVVFKFSDQYGPIWSNMHIYEHSICYCFCFISKSYHLNITRIIWKPNFRFFFSDQLPSIDLQSGSHTMYVFVHWKSHYFKCLTYVRHSKSKSREQISKCTSPEKNRSGQCDWLKINETKANKYTITHLRSSSRWNFFGPNSRMTHSEWVREREKKILDENLPIPIRYHESPCLKYKK